MQYILIADDNKDITDILSVYVKKEGYEPIIKMELWQRICFLNTSQRRFFLM